MSGTLGSLLFCRSRDLSLRRHAVQSILIDMTAIWSFGVLIVVYVAIDRFPFLDQLNRQTDRVVSTVLGGLVVGFLFVPRLIALTRLWHGGAAALPILWKMATGLTQSANRFDEAGQG